MWNKLCFKNMSYVYPRMIGQYQKVIIKSTTMNLEKMHLTVIREVHVAFHNCCFYKITLAPIYSTGEDIFFIFFFALLFRKINVYVQNIIHHALKAEVIQEMIAGKIRSPLNTHTPYTNSCVWTHHNPGTSSHSLPWLCQVTEEKTLKVSVKEILTDKVKSQTFSKKKVLWQ